MIHRPLAERLRPTSLSDIIGQKHLLGTNGVISKILQKSSILSMVLIGPCGTGKTTLASIIAKEYNLDFVAVSAVDTGVKDIKKIIAEHLDKSFVLFLDEIHRFSKSQQDVLLPYVESGQVILIGATTENANYYLNDALLSRLLIVRLYKLDQNQTIELINTAISRDAELSKLNIQISADVFECVYNFAKGDARKSLNLLERMLIFADISDDKANSIVKIDKNIFEQACGDMSNNFAKSGKHFYEQLSAFHKSIRGTDPDAAIFWLVTMLDNGVDPLVIIRRMLAIASEDIANADPQAMLIANAAASTYEMLGMPEGRHAISQAAIYLASAPKSNACYKAYNHAKQYIDKHGQADVPKHLKNYADSGYLYPHDYPNSYIVQNYLPNQVNIDFYQPTNNGFESKIANKLQSIKNIKRAKK